MDQNAIFLPALAMAVLTFVVWLRMSVERLGQMRRERIHPQAVASSAQMAARIKDSRAADNFRNLFELPVLFYVAVLVAQAIGQVTPLLLGLAWAFVALRVAHSAIHCSYNKVVQRFWAYLLGGLVLSAIWAALGFGLLK